MINYERHIQEINTLGYSIIEGVFDSATVTDLKKHLKVALENDLKMFGDKKGKKPELAVDLTIHNPVFIEALDNDIIQEMCNRLLGNSPILYSYTSTILKPNVQSGVHGLHIDSNKFIPGYLTGLVMTVALDDFTEENGATLYMPGSHQLENPPSEEAFVKHAQSTTRKAGDVLFFNPRVWHRAGQNKSNEIRYGLTMYATRNFFKQRFDFPRMIPKENLQGLSPRLISFLGFNSRVPDSVNTYYLPPEERTYKP